MPSRKGSFVNRNNTFSDVLHTAAVDEKNVDGHVDLAADTRKAGTVTQAFNGQIADGSLRGGGAAALERDGRDGCAGRRYGLGRISIVAAAVAITAAVVRHHGVAGDRYLLVVQLFLLQAAVVYALDLHAYLFLQAVKCVAGNHAGARTGVSVLVRIKGHLHASFFLSATGRLPPAAVHFQGMTIEGERAGKIKSVGQNLFHHIAHIFKLGNYAVIRQDEMQKANGHKIAVIFLVLQQLF